MFVCRFVPVVRHLISIPAGIARMNIVKFCVYTVIGATMWNCILLWVGYQFEENLNAILKYRTPIDVAMAGLLVLAVVAWYWLHLRKPVKGL